jgi:hypothetical protein
MENLFPEDEKWKQLALFRGRDGFYVEIIDEGDSYGAYLGNEDYFPKDYLWGVKKLEFQGLSLEEFMEAVDAMVEMRYRYYRYKCSDNPFASQPLPPEPIKTNMRPQVQQQDSEFGLQDEALDFDHYDFD